MRPDSPLVAAVVPSPNFGDRRGRPIDAIILHYTGMSTGAGALARLVDPASDVSCHYLVWEDGRIDQLVAEQDRAWHAGRSSWRGECDMNTVSIGIEIVNGGHEHGCPPYPDIQIDAVVALVADVRARLGIAFARVLAHSDIAPDRKEDPGEWFPWHRLDAGFVVATPAVEGPSLREGDSGDAVATVQDLLATIGYDTPQDGRYDARTKAVVTAFQRRWRPALLSGEADASTIATARLVALTAR